MAGLGSTWSCRETDVKITHQNAQVATNKCDELSIFVQELTPDMLLVFEHGSMDNSINFLKIRYYELASSYQ